MPVGEERKKEGRRRRTKLKSSSLVFPNLLKVCGTFGVDIALEN